MSCSISRVCVFWGRGLLSRPFLIWPLFFSSMSVSVRFQVFLRDKVAFAVSMSVPRDTMFAAADENLKLGEIRQNLTLQVGPVSDNMRRRALASPSCKFQFISASSTGKTVEMNRRDFDKLANFLFFKHQVSGLVICFCFFF